MTSRDVANNLVQWSASTESRAFAQRRFSSTSRDSVSRSARPPGAWDKIADDVITLDTESTLDWSVGAITEQPRGQGLPFANPDIAPRSEVEEQLVDCLSCASVLFCCPCVALTFPITCPRDYERAVIFRLGRLRRGGARGPGPLFINPFFDESKFVDMRIVFKDTWPQEILTKDSVKVLVDAVVSYRVKDAISSCCNVADVREATLRMCEGSLRSVLSKFTLSDLLERKPEMSDCLEEKLSETTSKWGVCVVSVEIKSINLPIEMMRSMSTEAQNEKLAAAKVLLSQAEEDAAEYLTRASACLTEPSAVTLRSLKTLVSMAQETESLAVFPFPMPEGYWLWGDALKNGMIKFTDVWGLMAEDYR